MVSFRFPRHLLPLTFFIVMMCDMAKKNMAERMNCLNLRPSSRIDNKNHFLIQTTRNSTQATKIVSHPYICVDQGVLQDSVFTDCPYPRPREPWWFYPSNLRDSPGFARHLFQGKADGSGFPSTPPPPPFFPLRSLPTPKGTLAVLPLKLTRFTWLCKTLISR